MSKLISHGSKTQIDSRQEIVEYEKNEASTTQFQQEKQAQPRLSRFLEKRRRHPKVPISKPLQHQTKNKIEQQDLHCMICCLLFKKQDLVQFSANCTHYFCWSCISLAAKENLKQFREIRCLADECNQVAKEGSNIYMALSQEEKLRYYKILIASQASKHPSRRLCPNSNCEGYVIVDQKPVCCIICGNQYCPKCMLAAHRGKCDQNGVRFLREDLHLKRCSKCLLFVEKNQGCNHMTCRCGNQFCYLCGEQWSSNHSCGTIDRFRFGMILQQERVQQTLQIERGSRETRSSIANVQSQPREPHQVGIQQLFANSILSKALRVLGYICFLLPLDICIVIATIILFLVCVLFDCFLPTIPYSFLFVRNQVENSNRTIKKIIIVSLSVAFLPFLLLYSMGKTVWNGIPQFGVNFFRMERMLFFYYSVYG